MKNKSFCLFLAPFVLCSHSVSANIAGDIVQDVELRTQYNIDEKDFNNTLRFKLGGLKASGKNEVLDLEIADEQAVTSYTISEINVLTDANNKKIAAAKKWRQKLSAAYSAYVEYLKSSPSSANSALDLKVLFFLNLSKESTLEVQGIDYSKANKKHFSLSDLAAVSQRESSRIRHTKNAVTADNNIIKFFEVGIRGNYAESVDNETLVRLGISLPLGFTGERIAKRKKRLADQYKLKNEKLKKELSFKSGMLKLKRKQQLLEQMNSKKPNKKRLGKITSSSSLSASDRLKVYLNAAEADVARIELQAEVALIHNSLLALLADTKTANYVGGGL